MNRVDQFRIGRPIYTSDFGDIHALTYRGRHRSGQESDVQDLFIATRSGLILGLGIQDQVAHEFGKPYLRGTLKEGPVEILPAFLKNGKHFSYPCQEEGTAAGIIACEYDGVTLIDSGHDKTDIRPKEGRWTRGFYTDGLELDSTRERILVKGSLVKKKVDITASLDKAGVDVPQTLAHASDYRKWSWRDGPF